MLNLHATTLAYQNQGLLLLGPSGSGKSDLALRLISEHGFTLVADDRTDVTVNCLRLVASAPQVIAGKLEVRGLGIVNMPYQNAVPLCLAVELSAAREKVERLPAPQTCAFENISLPLLRLYAFDASTPSKIVLAMQNYAIR